MLKIARQVVVRGGLIAGLSLLGLIIGISLVIFPVAVPFGVIACLLAVFLWVLPDIRVLPDGFVRGLFYVFVVASLSVPNYFALVFRGLPWLSVRKMALFMFVGGILFALAGSSKNRQMVADIFARSRITRALLIGMYVLMWISTILSSRAAVSVQNTILDSLQVFLPAVAVVFLFRTVEKIETLFKIIIVCASFDFAIGLIETLMHRPFLYQVVPASMRAIMVQANPLFAGVFEGGNTRNGIYRSASTFSTPLSWGEMAAMIAPLAAHFVAYGRSIWSRLYGAAGVAICFASIVCTGSRGAYIGFIAGTICYLLLWAIRTSKARPESLTGGIVFVIYSMLSMGILGSVLFIGRIRRVVLGGGEVQSSNDGRWAQWAMAKPKILARPLFGYGPGSSGDVIGYIQPNGAPSVDSYIMTMLVDYGIPGFLCFAAILLSSIFIGFRFSINEKSYAGTFGAAIGCSLVAYSLYRITLSQSENNSLMYILVGLLIAVVGTVAKAGQVVEREKGAVAKGRWNFANMREQGQRPIHPIPTRREFVK